MASSRFPDSASPDLAAVEQLKPALNQDLDELYWRKVRSQFNLSDDFIFLNHGTLGPTPRVVVEAHARLEGELSRNPADSLRRAEIEAVREGLARFVNASADEVALTRSTTEGMNIFAHGLDWSAGDEVLLSAYEHFGAYLPYQTLEKRFGVKLVWVDVPALPENVAQIVDAFARAISQKTRLLVVSHTTYVTGLVMPVKELAELAHAQGALISVDGAQYFGMLPLDLQALGVDHYAGSGQKWLLAGTGTGFMFLRKDLQDQVWPLMGYYDPEAKFHRARTARRYEMTGQNNLPSALGVGAAVALQSAIGKENIEARVRQLATRLRSGLKQIPEVRLWTSEDARFSAGLTAFSIADLPPASIVRAVRDRDHIVIRWIEQAGVKAARVSTHFFNTLDEMDRLLRAVRYLADNLSHS